MMEDSVFKTTMSRFKFHLHLCAPPNRLINIFHKPKFPFKEMINIVPDFTVTLVLNTLICIACNVSTVC